MKRQYFKQPEAATPQDISAALAGIFAVLIASLSALNNKLVDILSTS
ncbi:MULTISPECIES: hypothetical protein [Gibbsiella]|nr:hypothetical protein [Gibbsiella quercinecans]